MPMIWFCICVLAIFYFLFFAASILHVILLHGESRSQHSDQHEHQVEGRLGPGGGGEEGLRRMGEELKEDGAARTTGGRSSLGNLSLPSCYAKLGYLPAA